MRIVELLLADEGIQTLRKQLYEKTGKHLPFNYDCYMGIDDYKEYLRQCVNAGKIIAHSEMKHH